MKKNYFILIILTTFSIFFPRFTYADITSDLIRHYTLDDNAANTIVVDTGSDLTNGTSNRNTNLFHAAGIIGTGSLLFNGFSDVVESTSPTSLQGSSVFTVAFWAAPTTTASINSVVSIRNGTADANIFYISSDDSTSGAGPVVVWTNNRIIKQSNAGLTDGNFHFYAFVSSSTVSHAFYVDNVFAGFNSQSKSLPATLSNITIGGKYSTVGGSGFHNGRIDDVCIYTRALTVQELSDLYNSPTGCANGTPTTSFIPLLISMGRMIVMGGFISK